VAGGVIIQIEVDNNCIYDTFSLHSARAHVNLLPNSTVSLDGVMSTHPMSAVFLKPRVSTSDVKSATFFGGKLTTQHTSIPWSSSLVWAPGACTLEVLSPISDPKSIVSLKAGLRASGKSFTPTTFPILISTFSKSS